MSRYLVLILVLAALNAAPAFADDISWTWVEAGYGYVDPDGLDGEDSFRLAGSLSLPLNFYAFAEWENADIDQLDAEISSADLGLGWHIGLGDLVQGLAEVAYVDREAGPFDDDGYAVNVGVRVAPGDTLEFGAKAGYRDLDANLDGGYGEAYLLWKFWGPLGLKFDAELAQSATLRLYFTSIVELYAALGGGWDTE